MAVRLIALDIDGTVVPPGAMAPTSRTMAAIAALRAEGLAVVLASGRMFPGTADIARQLGLDTPMICQQGCSVHLPGGQVTHLVPLQRGLALDVVAYANHIGRAYEWFNPARYLASRESEATREYGRVSGIKPEYRLDPENAGVDPTGVGIISTRQEAPDVHRHLVRRHPDALHVLDFPEVTVAVAPEANKGHALSLICADLGIDRHEVVAIGDSVNDAAMLSWAGRGVAMPHSDAYALDAADLVLDSGVEVLARFLESLVTQRRP